MFRRPFTVVSLFILALLVQGVSIQAAAPPPQKKGVDPRFWEGKSPEEIAWHMRIGHPKLVTHPSFVYVQDDPKLPRVLLVGDSISIGYTLPTRKLLAGKANVHRIPANGGQTARGLANLEKWLEPGNWDAIHFNFGIHELKRIKDGKWDITGKPVSNFETYEKNLREIAKRLKATGAELVFATTTQIPAGAAGVPENGELELNEIAKRVMKEAGIPVNDLHAHLAKELEKHQQKANVHFDAEGSEYLAKAVAEHIERGLERIQAKSK